MNEVNLTPVRVNSILNKLNSEKSFFNRFRDNEMKRFGPSEINGNTRYDFVVQKKPGDWWGIKVYTHIKYNNPLYIVYERTENNTHYKGTLSCNCKIGRKIVHELGF